ncbi:MAG: hypothetical protein ACTHN5_03600 [Phycisphaerae bacterium]
MGRRWELGAKAAFLIAPTEGDQVRPAFLTAPSEDYQVAELVAAFLIAPAEDDQVAEERNGGRGGDFWRKRRKMWCAPKIEVMRDFGRSRNGLAAVRKARGMEGVCWNE